MTSANRLNMETPLQITFRGMRSSESIEAIIRQRVTWLERFHDRITHCHVVVDVPHRHQQQGLAYSIRVDVAIPTAVIVAETHDRNDGSNQDIHALIHEVFDSARRQLEESLRQHRAS